MQKAKTLRKLAELVCGYTEFQDKGVQKDFECAKEDDMPLIESINNERYSELRFNGSTGLLALFHVISEARYLCEEDLRPEIVEGTMELVVNRNLTERERSYAKMAASFFLEDCVASYAGFALHQTIKRHCVAMGDELDDSDFFLPARLALLMASEDEGTIQALKKDLRDDLYNILPIATWLIN